MAFPTGWTGKKKITIDNTKVSGSSNLTNFPVLIKDGNLSSDVYAGLDTGVELESNSLRNDANLEAYWRFASSSVDETANNNDGTDTSMSYTSGAGKFGNGASFNGSGYIVVDNTNIPLTGSFTFSLWVNPTSVSSAIQFFIANDNSSGTRSFAFGIDANGKIYFERTGTPFGADGTGRSLTAGVWNYVTLVYDGTNISSYINGILNQKVAMVGLNSTTNDIYIGRRQYTGSNLPFTGSMDDVAIFDRALTETEIKSIFMVGHDLRITTDLAGTTEIPFEIVSLDTSAETAEIWAKVPTLYYNTDTVFYIWYGNASATPYAANDTYGSQNVWTNYKAVYHFNSLISDSSASARTLTNNGGILQDTSSKLGSGTNYGTSNSSKYFTNTTMPATGSTGFTIQFWIKTSQTTNGNVYSVGWDNGSAHSFQFILNSVNANKIRAYWSGGLYALYSSTTINDGNWHRITYTYAGGSSGAMALYIDGSLEDSTTGTGGLSDQSTGTAEFIGRRSASAIDYFSGYTDDLRTIYGGTNPSADWIATEYANQNSPSTFLSLSDPIITTSVTKDLGYAILTEGLLQKDTDYKVLPTYSLTKSSDYTIINTIAAITKQADYAIKTILGITKNTDYYVKPTYSITKTAQYGVLRTIAAITKGLEYSILPPSVVLFGLDYLILLSMGITKDMAYRITLTNSLTKQFAYAVLTSTSITKTLDYYILLGSVIQKDLAYYVLSNPSLEKQLDYAIKTYSSIQKSLDYIIGITTAITKDSTYKVYATFEITKGMRYAIGVGGYIYNYTSRGTEYNEDYQYTERGNSYTDQYN